MPRSSGPGSGEKTLARRYFELFYERPARGWLGHVAFAAMFFRYGIGVVLAAAARVLRANGVVWELRVMVVLSLILYPLVLFWWHVAWAIHSLYPCHRCTDIDDEVFAIRSRRGALKLLRGYHVAADTTYWFYFQMTCVVMVGVASAGVRWVWAASVPLGLLWVGVTWSTWFHTRFGYACPRCHGEQGPGHGTLTFGPSQKRRFSW